MKSFKEYLIEVEQGTTTQPASITTDWGGTVTDGSGKAVQQGTPTQQQVEKGKNLIKGFEQSIDFKKEKNPQTILDKIEAFLDANPFLDLVLNFIPITAGAKSLVSIIQAIRKGDTQGALSSIASLIPGVGGQVARIGAAAAQGDPKAALAAAVPAFGKADAVVQLGQMTKNTLNPEEPTNIAQNTKPQPVTEDLVRIRKLAGI
jgi:hypothetical protein